MLNSATTGNPLSRDSFIWIPTLCGPI